MSNSIKTKKHDIEMECSRKENDEEDVKNVGLRISDWVPYIFGIQNSP